MVSQALASIQKLVSMDRDETVPIVGHSLHQEIYPGIGKEVEELAQLVSEVRRNGDATEMADPNFLAAVKSLQLTAEAFRKALKKVEFAATGIQLG